MRSGQNTYGLLFGIDKEEELPENSRSLEHHRKPEANWKLAAAPRPAGQRAVRNKAVLFGKEYTVSCEVSVAGMQTATGLSTSSIRLGTTVYTQNPK